MRFGTCLLAGALALVLTSAPASATVYQFTIHLDGYNEVDASGVGGQGDLDGSGTAILMIDDATGPPSISWDITVTGIDLPVVGAHIHRGPAGVNGPIVVDFSAMLLGGPLQDPDLADVLADPAGHYVNIHTNLFRGGAIRGQVPEPATLLLVGLGAALIGGVRRRGSTR